MKSITLWKCKNREGIYEHNHIEDGHVDGDKPKLRFPSQSLWKNGEWIKIHCWIKDGIIIHGEEK
jgi:hypothetical protein